MPNCVVKGCKNQSSKNKKQDGITYHTFPIRNKLIKEKWIEIIRLSRNDPSWNSTVRSVVCSTHFDNDDFYYTKKGLRRVLRNKYPKPLLSTSAHSENVDQSESSIISTDHPATPDFNEPSTSKADVPATPINLSIEPELTHTSQAHVPPTSVESIDPLLTQTPQAHVSASQILSLYSVQSMEEELRLRISRLVNRQKKMTKKIKILHQKVRRLKTRNKSLKGILRNLKKQN